MRPNAKKLFLGAEVETGWYTEDHRAEFFDALDAQGFDKIAISKFDRSIFGDDIYAPSEIVTVPTVPKELPERLATMGKIIADRGEKLAAHGCGVHIHASYSPIEKDTLWRVVSSIMAKEYDYNRGRNRPVQTTQALQDFWTLLALRRETQHCGRRQYLDFNHFVQSKGQHKNAVIISKGGNTVEFRLFKTPRSPVVMASYPEIVSSLLDFAGKETQFFEPKPAVAQQAPPDPEPDILNWVVSIQPALMAQTHGYTERQFDALSNRQKREHADAAVYTIKSRWSANKGKWDQTMDSAMTMHRGVTHEGFSIGHCQTFLEKFNNPLLARWFFQRAHAEYEQKVYGWKDGVFPLKAFTEYVIDNTKAYPYLSQRLKLHRFDAFTGRPAAPVVVTYGKDEKPFDTKSEHEAVRRGCLIKDESIPECIEMRVQSVYRVRDNMLAAEDYAVEAFPIIQFGDSPKDETYIANHEMTVSGDRIIHLCQGAVRMGGHEE
jgi:hypothetical protein